MLEKNKIKSEGNICTLFAIDASKYTNSFISLPIKLPKFDKEKNKLGEPTLFGLKFKFKGSKIGIEQLSITERKHMLSIEVSYKYNTSTYVDILKNNYKQANKIIKLFIKEK